MQKIPMTEKGLNLLQKKLDRLKENKRPRIINEIKKARSYGDLRENSEYHAAKEEQILIEKEINNIEDKILLAEIIKIKSIKNNGIVVFGSTIELENLNNEKVAMYKIVGEDEANIRNNKISINSPIARSLIGKNKGDKIKIEVPKGTLNYKIKDVKYI